MEEAIDYYMRKRLTESKDTALAMTMNRFWFSYDNLVEFMERLDGLK